MRRASSTSTIVRKVDEYFVDQLIASGSFSNVYRGQHMVNRRWAAIKIIPKRRLKKFRHCNDISFAETKLYPSLSHPNILPLIKVFETEHSIFQVQEYCKNDLQAYINENDTSFQYKIEILDQILSAIEYLHCRNICHRDIKLENILMSDSTHVFLADFGFSCFSTGEDRGCLGSFGYAPPEVLKCTTYNGIYADLWSTGVLIYSLFAGKYPFPNTNDPSKLNPALIDYSSLPSAIASMVRCLIQLNPKERIPISEVRANAIFDIIQGRQNNLCNIVCDFQSPQIIDDLAVILGEDHQPLLENTEFNVAKDLYKLIAEENGEYNEPAPPIPASSSCPLRSCVEDEFDSDEIVTVKCQPHLIFNEIRNSLLSRGYCVSIPKKSSFSAILNLPDDDRLISVSEVPSDCGCYEIHLYGNDAKEVDLLISLCLKHQ